MNRYIKLTLGGSVLLILVSVICYFWYHRETTPYQEEYAKIQQLASEYRASEKKEKPIEKVDDIERKVVDTVQHKPVSAGHAAEQTDIPAGHVNSPEIRVPQLQTTKDVDVSPYGLGAYPKIPDTWPQDVKFFPAKTIEHELMLRVEIELTNQGIDVVGSSMVNGRVYPNVEGKVYVRWTDDPRFGRYISEIGGHPETAMRFEIMLEEFESQKDRNFTITDSPSDIEVVDYDDSGIEPYSFLGL